MQDGIVTLWARSGIVQWLYVQHCSLLCSTASNFVHGVMPDSLE